jgi:hypothetical protein
MKIEIEIDDNNIIDQNDYADWYLDKTRFNRVGNVNNNSKCKIYSEYDGLGIFDLKNLTIKWDNGNEESIVEILLDMDEWDIPAEQYFEVGKFAWGVSRKNGQTKNILYGVND